MTEALKPCPFCGVEAVIALDTRTDLADQARADRIEELEAKLAKAVEALSGYYAMVKYYAGENTALSDIAYDWLNEDGGKLAGDTIAELQGGDA